MDIGGKSPGEGSPLPSNVTPNDRPSSTGRVRNLRRRFTTPAEILSASGTALDLATQVYSPHPDRKPSDANGHDITVSKNDSLDDIQTLIIHLSDQLHCIRFRYCSQLSASQLHDVISCVTPKLLSFEIRESEENNVFDLTHLEHLVTRCKHIRSLHFEDCFDIDSRCLEKIGSHLLQLQNIAFVHTKRKPWPDNPIQEIVTRIPLELHSVKFVGFDDISDFHVNYAVDCYFASLNAISLGDCPLITDRGVEYIATNCKLLRHIELFKTNISDSTLWILAKHCPNLMYIDFSSCSKITDYGVKELVTHATHLRYINLSGNPRIKDIAFQSIIRHCATIVRVKLNGTGVTRIPASVIARRTTLREISLNECADLTMPAPGTLKNGSNVSELFEQLDNRNLNYRLKVFFLGATGTGKTQLIRSLIGAKDENFINQPSYGVQLFNWRPFKEGSWENLINHDITEEERGLNIEFWDCDGRDVFAGVHPVYMSDNAVYICMCSLDDSSSVEKIPILLHTIYAKAHRPYICVVATRGDKYSEEECQMKLELIRRSIEGAELVRVNTINMELALYTEIADSSGYIFQNNTHDLGRQLSEKYLVRSMIAICIATGKGVDTLRRSLLNVCLDLTFPHIKRPVPPGWIELNDELMKIRDKRPLLTWHEFEQMALKEDRVSKPRLIECLGFFHQIGIVLDLRLRQSLSSNDVICINPEVLARALCALHIDDQKKSFRFEAKRFWPRDQINRPPDAVILASALEDIPNRALIKESLLPLIWQEHPMEEEQLLRLRTVALNACLLASVKSNRLASETLTLPQYPHFSPQTQYLIPLLGLLPDARPQLNWTSRPFRGDIQISLHVYILPTMPPGFIFRFLALVNNLSIESSSYHFYWKHGVLTRNSDVLVHLSNEVEDVLEISGRTTAEENQDAACVEAIWVEICYILEHLHEYMATNWPCLRSSIALSCYGDLFYTDERTDGEPEIPFVKVFHSARLKDDIIIKGQNEHEAYVEMTKLIPFVIAPTGHQDMKQWIAFIAEHRDKFAGVHNLSAPAEGPTTSQESSPSISRPKKKKVSLNWVVPDGEENTSRETPVEAAVIPNSVQQTHVHKEPFSFTVQKAEALLAATEKLASNNTPNNLIHLVSKSAEVPKEAVGPSKPKENLSDGNEKVAEVVKETEKENPKISLSESKKSATTIHTVSETKTEILTANTKTANSPAVVPHVTFNNASAPPTEPHRDSKSNGSTKRAGSKACIVL